MTDQAAIDRFLAEKKLAVVGVSHDKNKFGNIVYRRLRTHGFEIFAINPKINVIEGDPCFPNLAALPEPVGGVVIVVPPRRQNRWSLMPPRLESSGSGCSRARSPMKLSSSAKSTASRSSMDCAS